MNAGCKESYRWITVDVVTGRCNVRLTCRWHCVSVCAPMHVCVCMWHWSVNASMIVQLRIHAQCACACALITYAVIQLLCTWSLSSCAIIYAAHWLFCHVECSESLEREAHLTATKGCPADWFVLVHTYTPSPHTLCCWHMERCVHTHTHFAWGFVTVPQRGCWVWFYCLYWLWLGRVERSICGLSHSAPDHHCV